MKLKRKDIIVKCRADTFMPLAAMFGICVIMHGDSSPGGGFQGGVIVASAALLLYLGYGYQTTAGAINGEVLRINEAIGATLYVLLGACGLVMGVNFCTNVFYDIGNVGDLVSAGTITFMSWAVGYKVLTGVGFLLLLMLGLLAAGSDDEPEEEGGQAK